MNMAHQSGGTPRKFSEKIAIIERKQNEDVSTFEDIMREVRSITHDDPSSSQTAPMMIQGVNGPAGGGLHPPQHAWNPLSGSLPNVHQMPSYVPPTWAPGFHQNHENVNGGRVFRSRSPEQHVHQQQVRYAPYRGGQRSPDRTHLQYHQEFCPQPNYTLYPPENFNQINRARSDPAIHNMGMMSPEFMNVQQPNFYGVPGPSGIQEQQMMQLPGQMQNMHVQNNMSPLQSPNQMMPPSYTFSNGSPQHSPMGSPYGSSLMLDGSMTPKMELSPPMFDGPTCEAGSLPNLQQQSMMMQNGQPPGQQYYRPNLAQRHSTGACGPRLAPTPLMTPESQSAPTSPHNVLDPNVPPQWNKRTYSNSPESKEIPKLVLTNAEGNQGLDCFNDLNDLDTSEMNLLCNGDLQSPLDAVH